MYGVCLAVHGSAVLHSVKGLCERFIIFCQYVKPLAIQQVSEVKHTQKR
jgi:hypothetical protein